MTLFFNWYDVGYRLAPLASIVIIIWMGRTLWTHVTWTLFKADAGEPAETPRSLKECPCCGDVGLCYCRRCGENLSEVNDA